MDVSEKLCYWAECIIEGKHHHIFETDPTALASVSYKKKVTDYRAANVAAKKVTKVRATPKLSASDAAIAETERQYKDAKPKP